MKRWKITTAVSAVLLLIGTALSGAILWGTFRADASSITVEDGAYLLKWDFSDPGGYLPDLLLMALLLLPPVLLILSHRKPLIPLLSELILCVLLALLRERTALAEYSFFRSLLGGLTRKIPLFLLFSLKYLPYLLSSLLLLPEFANGKRDGKE